MARKRITQEFYSALVEALRESNGNFSYTARVVGCDRATAKRAWERGWVPRLPWAKPVEEVIKQEQREARAKLHDASREAAAMAEVARRKAEEQAAQTRSEEAALVKAARINATALLKTTATCLVKIAGQAKKIHAAIDDPETTASELVRMQQSITSMASTATSIAETTLRMERVLLGEPDKIVEHRIEGLTVDKAIAEIKAAQRAADRAGISLEVIEGGKRG